MMISTMTMTMMSKRVIVVSMCVLVSCQMGRDGSESEMNTSIHASLLAVMKFITDRIEIFTFVSDISTSWWYDISECQTADFYVETR